jgi:recombination associated protein RdgC
MPLLAGAVTFARFRASLPKGGAADAKRWLASGLRRHAFQPLAPGGEEARAAGFVEVHDADATAFGVGAVFHGEHALFAWRVDAVRVPPAAVKAELARWIAAFEGEHARPPDRREKAAARAAVRQALRERTAPVTRVYDVSLDLRAREVLVWAASRKTVDEIAAAIEQAFGVGLDGHAPAAIAAWSGSDPDALAPTVALVGVEGVQAGGADDAA